MGICGTITATLLAVTHGKFKIIFFQRKQEVTVNFTINRYLRLKQEKLINAGNYLFNKSINKQLPFFKVSVVEP